MKKMIFDIISITFSYLYLKIPPSPRIVINCPRSIRRPSIGISSNIVDRPSVIQWSLVTSVELKYLVTYCLPV